MYNRKDWKDIAYFKTPLSIVHWKHVKLLKSCVQWIFKNSLGR